MAILSDGSIVFGGGEAVETEDDDQDFVAFKTRATDRSLIWKWKPSELRSIDSIHGSLSILVMISFGSGDDTQTFFFAAEVHLRTQRLFGDANSSML